MPAEMTSTDSSHNAHDWPTNGIVYALITPERIADIERRLDKIELAVIAMYKRGFVGDSLSLVEMAPLIERVKLLAMEVKG